MDLKNKNILLTGGYGFIGVNLAVDLEKEGANVVIPTIRQIPMSPFTTYICDVKDYTKLKEITIKENIDIVIHLAHNTCKNTKDLSTKSFFENNYLTDLNVMELYRENLVENVIVVNPIGPVQHYKKHKGNLLTILIEASVYGPNDIKTHRLLPGLMKSAVTGEEPTIHPSEHATRDWIYVRDVSSAFIHILKKWETLQQHIVSIAPENEQTAKDVHRLIEKIGNKKIKFKSNASKKVTMVGPDDMKSLGWEPKYDFEEALKETYAWYKHAFKQ